jgi:hypothetical protein
VTGRVRLGLVSSPSSSLPLTVPFMRWMVGERPAQQSASSCRALDHISTTTTDDDLPSGPQLKHTTARLWHYSQSQNRPTSSHVPSSFLLAVRLYPVPILPLNQLTTIAGLGIRGHPLRAPIIFLASSGWPCSHS